MPSLTFVAHEVHRHGGQERAAAEVLTRLAPEVDLTVVARVCELPGVRVQFSRVAVPGRPAVLSSTLFARAAARAAVRAGSQLLQSIGAAAPEADLITAQFCQAAFTARFGGLRGGGVLKGLLQSVVQARFVKDERRAYGAQRLRRVIAVSTGVARELEEHYRVPPARITVIPNGVDHAVFHPVDASARRALRHRLDLPTDRCLALFLGGDWERKGLRDAISAVAGVPDSNLVVVGAGNQAPMREHAARVGAAAQVRFAGMSREPQSWYQAADFLLFPSRYEAFSLVTLEAAASGLPIVAHAINGTEDLITDGVNGFLSEWGADALRAHVARLRDDAGLRARMGAAAAEGSQRYAWDRIAAEHLRVVRECVA
ncbi:MAG: glycosyltransferase family 4 protein [Gemmatimonadota bacterium]|nr:glycosyltransferase family 4 protein [Gemmatimonadota bacterium]